MTEQIVIKLNKKKFQPILDDLIKQGGNTSTFYSECVGKVLFFTHLYFNKKHAFLDNKTKHEFILAQKKFSKDKILLRFLNQYNTFDIKT